MSYIYYLIVTYSKEMTPDIGKQIFMAIKINFCSVKFSQIQWSLLDLLMHFNIIIIFLKLPCLNV